MINLYEILGVNSDASTDVISEAIARAEQTGEIGQDVLASARQELLHPDARQRYDQRLAVHSAEINCSAEPVIERQTVPALPRKKAATKGALIGLCLVVILIPVALWLMSNRSAPGRDACEQLFKRDLLPTFSDPSRVVIVDLPKEGKAMYVEGMLTHYERRFFVTSPDYDTGKKSWICKTDSTDRFAEQLYSTQLMWESLPMNNR